MLPSNPDRYLRLQLQDKLGLSYANALVLLSVSCPTPRSPVQSRQLGNHASRNRSSSSCRSGSVCLLVGSLSSTLFSVSHCKLYAKRFSATPLYLRSVDMPSYRTAVTEIVSPLLLASLCSSSASSSPRKTGDLLLRFVLTRYAHLSLSDLSSDSDLLPV